MALGNLAFTFTAGTNMELGAQVKVTIPTGWDAPFLDNNDGVDAAGEVSLTGSADLSVSGGGAQPWTLTATTTAALVSGNTVTINYKNVTSPMAEAVYTFATTASVAADGSFLPLQTSPIVIVRTPVAGLKLEAMDANVPPMVATPANGTASNGANGASNGNGTASNGANGASNGNGTASNGA